MIDSKNIPDNTKQEDENFLTALVVLVGLLALFFIISYWSTIALYISPTVTWLNSVALPSIITFLSTGIGITLTIATGALIAAGVITYIASISPVNPETSDNTPLESVKSSTGGSLLHKYPENKILKKERRIGLDT